MAQDEHHIEIAQSGDRYRATCWCGWSSKPSPDRTVAEFHGNRHLDGVTP